MFFFLSVGEVVCKSRYVNVQRVKNDLHTASVSHMLRVRVFSITKPIGLSFFFFFKRKPCLKYRILPVDFITAGVSRSTDGRQMYTNTVTFVLVRFSFFMVRLKDGFNNCNLCVILKKINTK